MIKLITSAAYVNQELAIEFGRLPPSFLSIGVNRLYEAQIPAMGGGPTFMTLPESFRPDVADLERLQELGVTLISVPDDISLAESILYALAVIADPNASLMLMHGDTLVEDTGPFSVEGNNRIAVQAEGDDYSWATVTVDGDRVLSLADIQAGAERDQPLAVVCGLFSFSSCSVLMKALARARGSFVRGLALYAAENDVRSVTVVRWSDFGHLQTYFRSRRAITTARAFNTLRIDAETARKSSTDRSKMEAEAHWLRCIPPDVQPYTARLLDVNLDHAIGSYTTEYLYAPTLAELFVFSNLGRPTWRRILDSCGNFLALCARTAQAGSSPDVLNSLVAVKTLSRLEAYERSGGLPIDRPLAYEGRPLPSLRSIAAIVSKDVGAARAQLGAVMHGDFCFSNILYNSRTGRINVIDPRGYVEAGQPSIYGDTRYDLAKMAHSIIGRYDHILAGRYRLQIDGSSFSLTFADNELGNWLAEAFSTLEVAGIAANSSTVRAITISLFLSMLPLHADRPDRQQAFIANALRLFASYQDANL